MTESELAERAGCAPERVRQLIELGIVKPREADGPYRPSDIQRVRLADAFEVSGIPIEDIAAVMASGHVTLAGLDLMFARPVASLRKTFRELAEEAGRSPDEVRRLYGQLGLPQPMDGERVREDDAEILPALLAAWDLRALDVRPEISDRMARICGENMYRLVRAFAQLWETAVDEPVERSGSQELYQQTLVRSVEALEVTERAAVWLFRRFVEHEIVEDIVDNVEDTMEEAGLGRRRAATLPAIAFLDLTGFTRLTESRGDEDAAELAAMLGELVRRPAAGAPRRQRRARRLPGRRLLRQGGQRHRAHRRLRAAP
jgi:adenylate cyclase